MLPSCKGQNQQHLQLSRHGNVGTRGSVRSLPTQTTAPCYKLQEENLKLTEVAKRGRAAPGRGVAVVDTGHHQQLLGDGGGHDPRATGGRDQTHQDRPAAASDLRKRTGYSSRNTLQPDAATRPRGSCSPCMARCGACRSCSPSSLVVRVRWII